MADDLSTTRTDLAQVAQADPISDYLEQLDVAPRSAETYRRALSRWRAWLGDNGLGVLAVTRADVLRYRDDMEAQGLAPASVKLYLSAVRGLYGWLAAERVYPDVTAGIRNRKAAKGPRRDALTAAQAVDLLDEGAGSADPRELRDRALTSAMVGCGLRCVEVSRADVSDLSDLGGRLVLRVRGKGRADAGELVVLVGRAEADVRLWLLARAAAGMDPAAGPLWCSLGNRSRGGRMEPRSVSRVVKARLRAAGMDSPRLTAHSLRHTAVTLALVGGATVQEAQGMARHADVSTTMVYAHNLDRMDAAAERAVDSVLDAAERGAA